jgi:uncharacterized protein YegL
MGNASSTTDQVPDEPITAVAIEQQQSTDPNMPVAVATPVDETSTTTENPVQSGGETGVKLTMSTEYSVYSSTSEVETLIGVNLQASAAPSDNDRAPVDCVVVSDVSGSMRGAKIDLLKSTVNLLLDEFVAKDRVGLVTFDTDVKERYSLQSVTSDARQAASTVVDSFRAGTSTNLSGGCFAGIQQLLKSEESKDHIRTVLLMTDGQANQGLRSAKEIIPILTNMLKDSGISLHTFGYGSDHDSDLLRKISTAGNGSYYFVEGVDDIRSAFGDCLGGMLSVVAQNLEVELEAVNGATITKVHHKKAVVVEANKKYRVPFADLYGDEQRDVLVGMRLPAVGGIVKDNTSKEAQVLKATLRYIDVLAAMPADKSSSIGAFRAVEVNESEQVQNQKLAVQSARIKVAETLESAKSKAEKGDLSAARASIESTRAELRNLKARRVNRGGGLEAEDDDEEEMMGVFEDDLRECADGLVSQSAYRKAAHKMTYLAEGHMQQRCMESTVVPQMNDVMFGATNSAPPVLRKNAYRTKAKSSKASKFSSYSGSS